MTSGAELFADKDQASAYAQFRPSYPDELFSAIYEYAGPPQAGIALDVATGNGQAAAALAKQYRTVHAQDASAEQVAAAPSIAGVHFEVAPSGASGLPDASVDLVTVAQAMHWFDIPAFHREAARVLRPGGTIAIWTYDRGTFVDEPAATAALEKLFTERLGPYWDPRMRLAMVDQYRGSEPEPPLFEGNTTRHTFTLRKTFTIDQILGWIRSWSGYAKWRAAKVPGPDPLLQFHGDLKDALEFDSHSDEAEIEYQMYLLLARRTGDSTAHA